MDGTDGFSEFLFTFRTDLASGRLRSLEEYVQLWPAIGMKIEAEYRRVTGRPVDPPAEPLETFAMPRPPASPAPSGSGPGNAACTIGMPRTIGSYRVVRCLGDGGQGVVFLADDLRLDRRVAIKVLKGASVLEDIARRRLEQEARILSRIDHPAICAIFETGTDTLGPFIAMRYVEGKTLAQMISDAALSEGHAIHFELDNSGEGTPSEDSARESGSGPSTRPEILETARLIEEVARGLHVAHECGVIHRDIKPRNIMVRTDGQPVVLDFGLAADEGETDPLVARSGDLLGTCQYMSPEQLLGNRLRLDRRTDVFSLGVTLYECLALQRPFQGPSRQELLAAIQTKEPPRLHRVNRAIPRDLEIIVEKALEKDRDRRYSTALELAEDLRRFINREPIAARPTGPVRRFVRWVQRNSLVASLVLGLFVAILAGLVLSTVLVIQKESERRRANAGERAAREALSEIDRLGDVVTIRALIDEARDLWPMEPARLADWRSWLARAEPLRSRWERHREDLVELVRSVRPAGATVEDAESLAAADEKWMASLSGVHRVRALGLRELVILGARMFGSDRSKCEFANVTWRLEQAVDLREKSIDAHAGEWNQARARVAADQRFQGLALAPQLGLVPLGRDPSTKLEEFVHVQTGTPPRREADGRLAMDDAAGVVLVLVAGGTFRMGADPSTDPSAASNEVPSHSVTLSPFFVSKFETTQSQFLRVMGYLQCKYRFGDGGMTGGKGVLATNPVESVSWSQASAFCRRLRLLLPTESQWEYACRGGTTTTWWTGPEPTSLEDSANLADAWAKSHEGAGSWPYVVRWSDGYTVHAPVGSFLANGFGLHDVTGNVWEWCRDPWTRYGEVAPEPYDGARVPKGPLQKRVFRGGAFDSPPVDLRSSSRGNSAEPEFQHESIGFRVVRVVDP